VIATFLGAARRGRWRWIAAASLALVSAATFALAAALRTPTAARAVEISARPIASFDRNDPSRRRFGQLEFRGGLELTADAPAFGGISAIRVAANGADFVAVTDHGVWLRGRIVYDGDRPSGIADAEMAPLLGADGKPLAARGRVDAESLAMDGGLLYVGLEKAEQVLKFDYGRDGLAARGTPVTVPAGFRTLNPNKSLECLVALPAGVPQAGAMIAVSEQSLDDHGNLRSFLFRGADAVRFSVKRSADFDVSDCEVVAPDALLILERRFTVTQGIAIRIRRLQISQLAAGGTVAGPVLMEADLGYQIDNMEGLAMHRNAQGETILTLVSDDNFSPVQRTLLLQFALVGE
jgi:hypothetical protein